MSRTALVNRLRTERSPIIAVVAPAGYGKSTLLAQWAQRDTRTFAWLALEGEDDGDGALRATLAHAIAAATTGKPPLVDLLDATTTPRTFVRRLGRTLEAFDGPLVVVLDDAGTLSSKPALRLVSELCDHLPRNVQVVLAARSVPALPFARWRAEGRLGELTSELALTDREAAALLAQEHVELDVEEARALNARAEGWATGLYLAARVLQPARGRPQRDVASIHGDHHFVADYLESEVFSELEPADLDFATGAALLERMAGPICDAVLGEAGCAVRLRRLDDHGGFLVPLDRERSAFRFHTFVRESLVRRLEQQEPARFAELHRRAAAWYEARGDVSAAIAHLRAVADDREAARLLGTALDEVCARGLLDGLLPVVEGAGDIATVGDDAAAAIAGAFVLAFVGRSSDAGRWAAFAFDRADDVVDDDVAARISLLHAALCQDGAARMRSHASRAAARIDPRSPLSPFAVALVGISHLLRGDVAAAESAFVEAAEAAAAVDAPLVRSLALAELSLIAQSTQEWAHGEDLALAARDAADALPEPHVCHALAYVASARSALRHSNWVRAEDDLERAQLLLPIATEALPWLAVQLRMELMRPHLALNSIAEADELAADLERLIATRPHLGALCDEARHLISSAASAHEHESGPASSLTAAELRLLPLLTTHLTFRQIAQHLYVSRNTIKTQAISVYRKLGVSSRTEAIDRAVELGLLRPDAETVEHRV